MASADAPETATVAWVDPDDAPEWTEAMCERADLYDGVVLVRRGHPAPELPRKPGLNDVGE